MSDTTGDVVCMISGVMHVYIQDKVDLDEDQRFQGNRTIYFTLDTMYLMT